VTDCIVVGVRDETWGERVAAVIDTPNERLTEEELQDWVRSSLAGYKVPRSMVLLRALRRTPTGKLEVSWAKRVIEENHR
jgi:acyl-CoA synthetase (AMP-forming)/AMP-acid ligase II